MLRPGIILLSSLVLCPPTFAQDGPPVISVGKTNAARYRAALKKYKEAQDALDAGDLPTAFDKSTEIIEDPKIEKEKRECQLRIQNADSTWDPPAAFFPVFVHAKSGHARALKQIADGKKEDGLAKLQGAKTDVEESALRKVPGALDLLKEINDAIAANSTNEEDPLVKKRRAYEAKLRDALTEEVAGQFAAAKKRYEEALGLDDQSAKAKEGIARMEGRLREEEAFAALTALADTDEKKLPACDAFLQKFKGGAHFSEITSLKARLLRAASDIASDRERAFREQWLGFRSAGKFKSALDHIQKQGPSVLKPEALKDYAAQTSSACDTFIAAAVRDFRLNLSNLDSVDALAGLGTDTLERDYALPNAAELVTKSAGLDWCRGLRPALEKLRSLGVDADAIEAVKLLSPSFLGALPLADAAGENAFFRPVETLLRSYADHALSTLVNAARQADEEGLKNARKKAGDIIDLLVQLDKDLSKGLKLATEPEKAWRDRHGWDRGLKGIKRRPEEFPQSGDALKSFGDQLGDAANPEGIYGPNAIAALDKLDRELKRYRQNEGSKLTKDGQRRLLTYLASAGALRALFDGLTAEQAAKQLEELGTDLRSAGGCVKTEVKKLGPKVEKVFAILAPEK